VKQTRRQQGFTLLEIMIALTIFAVISTLAWQILDGAMRTSSATDASAAKLNQLQRAWNLLERDFFQLQGRAPRNGTGVFRLKNNALEMTTLNGVSGQVQLERVRWRLEGGRLWRDVWPTFDGPANAKPDEVPIVNEVKAVQWRFWQGGWQNAWRDSDTQPDGVELTLTMESGDRWRWVFTTPDELPAEAAKPAEPTADKPTDVPAETPPDAQTPPETPPAPEAQP